MKTCKLFFTANEEGDYALRKIESEKKKLEKKVDLYKGRVLREYFIASPEAFFVQAQLTVEGDSYVVTFEAKKSIFEEIIEKITINEQKEIQDKIIAFFHILLTDIVELEKSEIKKVISKEGDSKISLSNLEIILDKLKSEPSCENVYEQVLEKVLELNE